MELVRDYNQEEEEVESRPEKKQARFDDLSDIWDTDILLQDDPTNTWNSRMDNSVSTASTSDAEDDIALFGHGFTFEGNDVDPDKVDSLLARELTGLSMADREKVYFDVHGVSAVMEETPEMVKEAIESLQKELNQSNNAEAYKRALAMDSSYVQDTKFFLKFLRAERFDPEKAANRMARFFAMKLELFGPELLVTDITQDDLDDDDIDALYSGVAYDLPFRDRAGRAVLIQFPQDVSVPLRAVLRKTFYYGTVSAEDEETQKKGAVILGYLVGRSFSWEHFALRQHMNREWGKIVAALPIRVESIHFCADSFMWRPIIAICKFAMSMFNRVRVREHMGSHKEVQFSLQTFGISTVGFPITEDGQELGHLCADRWKKRRMLEQKLKKEKVEQKSNQGGENARQQSTGVRVENPSQYDVLLGRGKSFYTHAGNMRLRSLVIERYPSYENAGFAGKQKVSGEIVDLLKSQSCRFLKDDGAGWVEVDGDAAEKKVSHLFRTLRGIKNTNATKSQCVKRRNIDEP